MSQKTMYTVGENVAYNTDNYLFRHVTIGGNLGMGYFLNDNIHVNLNYTRDFQRVKRNTYTEDGGYSSNGPERNSGFILSLSYLF